MFTDTHCHIFKEYYDDLDGLYEKMLDSKIYRVINNGTDKDSNIEVMESINNNWIYGAIGIHPEYVDSYDDKDIDFIINNINNKRIVAIGEIGLDYHYTKENRDKQIELFRKQLKIAEDNNIPVIIHSREATNDTIECLKDYKVKGVIHSFSGSYETALIYIKMGFVLGINGVITFKNCNLKDVINKIDLDNLLLETDSPYLTPEPYRGKKNDPSHIIDIANFISKIKGISINELSNITEGNIKRVFDI